MKAFLIQTVNRLLGHGLTAGAAWVGVRYGVEWGTAAGAVGGLVLNKLRQNILPRPARSSDDVTEVVRR